MKDLSLKEQARKARRYNEAIELISKCETDKYGCIIGIKPSDIFPELNESEDQKIKRAIYKCVEWFGFDSKFFKDVSQKECLDWIEKQCEQSKPKFNEGDWIVQENIGVYKVIEVCESWYEVIDTEDNHYSISFDKEYMCHLWTINDAKDGDILACNKEILLFKSYSVQDRRISLYCWYNGKTNNFHNKEVKDILLTTKNKIDPATKEQREQFEKTITNSGYEWDAEKKELKKIAETNKKEDWYDFIRWFVDKRTEQHTLIPSANDIHKWGDLILSRARELLRHEQGLNDDK